MNLRSKEFFGGGLPWALGFSLVMLPYSVTLCHAGFFLAILCWIIEGDWRTKVQLVKGSWLIKILLVYGVLLLVGLLYTEQTHDGWFSLERKVFLFVMPVVIASTRSITQLHVRRIFWLFVASCLLVALICLVNAVGDWNAYRTGSFPADHLYFLDPNNVELMKTRGIWFFLSYIPLASAISIHPTYLSLYMSFCCVFIFFELPHIRHTAVRCAGIALAILFAAFLSLLASRVIMIAVLLLLSAFVLGHIPRQNLITRIAIGMAIVVVLSVMLGNPISRKRQLQEVVSTPLAVQDDHVYANSIGIRVSLWWLGWQSYVHGNVLVGNGTGDVLHVMEGAARSHGISNILNTYDPHNQYLYILIGNGLLAFAAFVLYLMIPAFRAWQSGEWLMVAFTFLIAMTCFTETVLELQKGIAFFALVHPLLAFRWAPRNAYSQPFVLSSAES